MTGPSGDKVGGAKGVKFRWKEFHIELNIDREIAGRLVWMV